MPKYPIARFREFYNELKEQIGIKRYSLSLEVIGLAKSAYREGGFAEVESTIKQYTEEHRLNITGNAILYLCDNWRHAFSDLEKAIKIAREFSDHKDLGAT